MAKNQIELLKANVQMTNDLGVNLLETLNEMESVKREVGMMKKSVTRDIGEFKAEMTGMVQEVRDERELTYEQQKQLQSIVQTKSTGMTKEYYSYQKVMSDLFKKKKGQFIRGMWKRLKTEFDVPRYTSIRKVDFQAAFEYLKSIDFKDFEAHEIENKRSWNIPGLFEDEK